MALQSDRNALIAAWRGMSAVGTGEGWQTISLGTSGSVALKAAKLFPGGLEAFLVGFPSTPVPADASLPQAQGFRTIRTKLQGEGAIWVAVIRNGTGNLELFAAMASDVLSLLQMTLGTTESVLLGQVIARITAWQRFMERGSSGLLSIREELGLFGELVALHQLLVGEPDVTSVVESWTGPLGTLHDFPIGAGALEIKTTLAGSGFLAKITGLDQLDTSIAEPLFVVAVRLATGLGGTTIGDYAAELLEMVGADGSAVSALVDRLLSAGLPRQDFTRYTRRFETASMRIYRVTHTFPRLIRGNLPPQITSAKYTVDLDLLTPDDLSISQARDILRNS